MEGPTRKSFWLRSRIYRQGFLPPPVSTRTNAEACTRPPPEPTPNPESGPDHEISLPLSNGNYGQVIGRGPDPEETLDRKHEVVDILDFPMFLHPAKLMTLDQILAYYPDLVDRTKATLPSEFVQQFSSPFTYLTITDTLFSNQFLVEQGDEKAFIYSRGTISHAR